MPSETTIRLNKPLVLIFIVLLVVLAFLIPSDVFYYLFYAALLLLLGSYYWTWQTGAKISLERQIRDDWVQVGDKLREYFVLNNRSRLPVLWLEVEDRSTLPGYEASRVESVGPGERRRWRAESVCRRRGLYVIGPARLSTGDPFGLFTASCDAPETRSFLVYPPIWTLPGFDLPRGALPGSSRSSLRTQEVTTLVSSTRPYVPGDSLNRIHWLSTARQPQGNLIVKEFDLEPSGNLWIVLDMDESVQAGSGDESTEEYGVALAASLAYKSLEQSKSVGLITYGDNHVVIPPDRGRRQLGNILRELAVARAKGSYPVDRVLVEVSSSMGRGMTLAVITPSLNPDWVAILYTLARRGLAPAAILLDAVSFGGLQQATSAQAVADDLTRLGLTAYIVQKGQHFPTLSAGLREGAKQPAAEVTRTLATGRVITQPVSP